MFDYNLIIKVEESKKAAYIVDDILVIQDLMLKSSFGEMIYSLIFLC